MEKLKFFEMIGTFAKEFRDDAYTSKRFAVLFEEFGHLSEAKLGTLLNELLGQHLKYSPPTIKHFRVVLGEISEKAREREKKEETRIVRDTSSGEVQELRFRVPDVMKRKKEFHGGK